MSLYLLGFLFVHSCATSSSNDVQIPVTGQSVFIICEGNYGAGNSSLSILDTALTDTTYSDVYMKVNGRKLGDHAHSMTVKDSLGYIAITGSDRVEVINLRTFERMGTISNINTPRDLTIAQGRLFVTSYEDSSVVVVDLSDQHVETTIKLDHRPDEIVAIAGTVFVSCAPNFNRDTVITYFDATLSGGLELIRLSRSPITLAADYANGFLYAGCDSAGYIVKIDASTKEIISIIGSSIRVQRVAVKDSIIACIAGSNGPIHVYNTMTGVLIATLSGNFRGLSISGKEIFATNAADFLAPGELIWFSAVLKERHRYPVGRVPAQIVFSQ